eukprot:Opistho-2@90362
MHRSTVLCGTLDQNAYCGSFKFTRIAPTATLTATATPAPTNPSTPNTGLIDTFDDTNVTTYTYFFGRNVQGMPNADKTDAVLVPYPLAGPLTGMSMGSASISQLHGVIRSAAGLIGSWGFNGNGQLGLGDLIPRETLSFIQPQNGSDVFGPIVKIVTGYQHNLAINYLGQVFCFGDNKYGQCGQAASVTTVTLPTRVRGLIENEYIIEVAAGSSHSIACNGAGRCWSWGRNDYGQLGLDLIVGQSNIPAPLVGLSNYTIVSLGAGDMHSVACSSNGSVFSWGRNDRGQLGVRAAGEIPYSYKPVVVTSIEGIVKIIQVKAGYYHTVALSDVGKVYFWGLDLVRYENFPVLVEGSLTGKFVRKISASSYTSTALTVDGQAFAFGFTYSFLWKYPMQFTGFNPYRVKVFEAGELFGAAFLDDEPIGAQFAQKAISVAEDSGIVRVDIGRLIQVKSPKDSAVNVTITLLPGVGDATPDVDFQFSPQTLLWYPGDETMKSILLRIIDDHVYEPPEKLTLLMRSNTSETGYLCELTITDDGDAGVLGFAETSLLSPENVGVAFAAVRRSGQYVSGRATAIVEVVKEKSTASQDGTHPRFVFSRTVLTWEDGDREIKSIALSLINDAIAQVPDEYIVLNITSATAAGIEPFRQQLKLTIVDDGDVLVAYDPTYSMRYALAGVAALLQIVTLAAAVLVYVKRKDKVFKASSPKFCLIILLGCMFAYSVVYAMILPATTARCTIPSWLGHISFAIAFGALFAKTHRVMTIFGNRRLNKRINVGDERLLAIVGSVVGVVVVYLSVWTAVDGPTPTTKIVQHVEHLECANTNTGWAIALYASEGAFLLWGVYLSWRTRSVTTLFNESKFIAMAIWNIFFIAIIVLPMSFAINTDDADTQFLFTSIGMIAATTVVLALIFGPKVYVMHRRKHKDATGYRSSYDSHNAHTDDSRATGTKCTHCSHIDKSYPNSPKTSMPPTAIAVDNYGFNREAMRSQKKKKQDDFYMDTVETPQSPRAVHAATVVESSIGAENAGVPENQV